MMSHSDNRKKLLIIGNGMTSFKFCQKMVEKELTQKYQMIVFGEERYVAYDRVNLTKYYTGSSLADLEMEPRDWYDSQGITLYIHSQVTSVDPSKKTVSLYNGEGFEYDILVFATGSSAFVPSIKGIDLKGVFVYRTIEDIDAIKKYINHSKKGAVIGGGLLGLEAARALMDDGLSTTIIEYGPWLMRRQLDEAGGNLLIQKIKEQQLDVLTLKSTKSFIGNGKVEAIQFQDGEELKVDLVVISAGIRPRDELARQAGIEVGQRGGIVVNEKMETSEKDIYAIGECALANGMIWGLVAPCYSMAEVLTKQLAGEEATFESADMSTKLKLIGTEVASFGDATGATPGSVPLVLNNQFSGIYKRLNISADGTQLLGGILVGDASDYNMLHQVYKSKLKLPRNPESIIYGSSAASGGGLNISVLDLPDDAGVCSCEGVSKGKICKSIDEFDLTTVTAIKKHTKAGTGCGGCAPMLDDILTAKLKASGKVVKKILCEHFNYTRQELFDLVKIEGIRDYNTLLKKHGKGLGCEICKPAVASILASSWNEHITRQSTIQDTNDRFLANIQRGGTYSVVPRVPGGEITPEKLQVIGSVAHKYKLYTKITGGQRIDMFGAKVNELPMIWNELIAAGFESGHAYGKALRTVKSCVGSTWCRFGLHDSVSFAIEIENRYKGLRAPHKIKGGVSGCIRECAEARGKDFGVIATEKGWNLYICGNGGANPAHAVLLASDLDKTTLVKYLDRFLIYYIRSAQPLTRTSKWLASLEGGIDHLRDVVIDDCLGKGEEFEKEMQELVDAYKCEWKEVVDNPNMMKKFRAFVNTDESDENISFVNLRGQKMPVEWVK